LSYWLHKEVRTISREIDKAYAEASKREKIKWEVQIRKLEEARDEANTRTARDEKEAKEALTKQLEKEQDTNMVLEANQNAQSASLGETRAKIFQLTASNDKVKDKLTKYQQQGSVHQKA
jgi:hypothetical protein